ncbi:MAG: hypothetical protein FJY82_07175 [Candidatus Aminicenantes bacterium]|nr:hypothetical protein [Candidatus Aminicenantes bacterium]
MQVPKGERKVGVSAGRLMLQELGLLESVRVQVGRLAEERPADEKLKNLAAGLSPYADIAVLVENRKYDEAIAALTGLGPEALGAKEAKRLLARSYLEKGRQEFSLKRYDAALENWKKGLAVGELGEEIRQTVVGETKSRAALLQTSEPETAIGMLRKAGKVVKDKELTETLAEILTTRGIGLINEAQKKLQEGKEGLTAEIETQIDKGVKCLKEAKDLGSKRGAENYERAKGLVEQAKSGLLGLDPEIAGLINQAHKAAEGSRWDEAIRLMKKARDKAPEAGREALEKMLAQFYNARGVQKLSGATSRMKTLKDMMLSGKGNFDLSAFMKDGLGKNLSSKSSGKAKTAKTNKKKALVWILIAAVVIVLLLMINKSSMKIPKFVTVLLYAAWILAMIAPVLVELFAKMRKFFKTTLNPNLYMPHIYGQPPRPKCSWCDKTADYTYDGQYLCSGCVETAKKMNEPQLAPGDDLVVKSARSDFEKAAKLDPGTSVFRSNLDQAREICRQFNLV